MCGRITQYRSKQHYANELGWTDRIHPWAEDILANYNIPPGTSPWLMHRLSEDHMPGFTRMKWGYRPDWAEEKGFPVSFNARIEKAKTGKYFRHMWKSGRVIVPADGWYEWTGEKGHKQPWYIRFQTKRPMFLAAIANYKPDEEREADASFVVVTAAADGGMIDVHDRRPVVLSPVDAELWMDPDISAEQAEQIARSGSLPSESFEWYRVSTDVNKTTNKDAHLIEPVD